MNYKQYDIILGNIKSGKYIAEKNFENFNLKIPNIPEQSQYYQHVMDEYNAKLNEYNKNRKMYIALKKNRCNEFITDLKEFVKEFFPHISDDKLEQLIEYVYVRDTPNNHRDILDKLFNLCHLFVGVDTTNS